MKDLDNVPESLKSLNQWLCWKKVVRDGRETKMPVNAMTGDPAKSNDPTTWTDFVSACDGAVGLGASGVGFCFSPDDGLVGIDLDVCIDSKGNVAEWALVVLHKFESYAEISPSGRGLKIWCRGTIPKGYKKTLGDKDPELDKAPGIEVYASGRYFTVTGDRWEGLPRQDVVTCQPALDWLIERYWPAGPEPVQTTETPKQYTYPQTAGQQGLSVQERAARYLDRLPVTECGTSSCHDRTFRAACICVLGFAMTPEQARDPLLHWCGKGGHSWNDKEIDHKLDQANKQGGERGWLLSGRTYNGPDVDLRNILQEIDRQDIEPANITPDPETFPSQCLEPPGFLGDLIRYNVESALYPMPELALAGHLALLSTLCGQKIQDAAFGTRPNGYFCGLAPSGGGKDYARKLNKRVLLEAGVSELEGEENFASAASIWTAADENPVGLYQLDEIASLLATTNDAKRSPHLFKIIDTFLRLYSGSDTVIKADAYADRKKNKVAQYPNIVIYGTSVAQAFWESLSATAVTDGLLGRFFIFEQSGGDRNGYVEPQLKRRREPIPESIIRTAAAWRNLKTHNGNLADFDGSRPLELEHTPEAYDRAEQHLLSVCEKKRNEEREEAAVWTRAPEKTNKLALLFAASRATAEQLEQGVLPVIELDDVNRAIALSNWLTRRLLHKAGLHVAQNDWERIVQQSLLKLTVGKEIKRRDFTRKTRNLKNRERDEVLAFLLEAGFISMRQDTAANGNLVELITRLF